MLPWITLRNRDGMRLPCFGGPSRGKAPPSRSIDYLWLTGQFLRGVFDVGSVPKASVKARASLRTVFVDFDNTLHRSDEKLAFYLDGWTGKSGDYLLEVFRKIHLEEIHAHFPERHLDIRFHSGLLLSYLRLPHSPTLVQDFVSRYLEAASDAWLDPWYYSDTLSFLDELVKMRVKVCLTTGEDAEKKAVGIYKFLRSHKFDYVFGEDALGVLKTEPEYFTRALKESWSEAPSTVAVGDSITADVVPGKLAGLKVIWVNREGKRLQAGYEKPDFQVSDLREASKILWRMCENPNCR